MRATVQFDDQSKELLSRTAVMTDNMLGQMAAGIEIQIKTSGKTPYKKGGLRSHARHIKLGPNNYQVSDDQEYAAAQEAGTNPHPIRHYTTPGTGKGFFRAAIDTTLSRADDYARSAANAAGLGEF